MHDNEDLEMDTAENIFNLDTYTRNRLHRKLKNLETTRATRSKSVTENKSKTGRRVNPSRQNKYIHNYRENEVRMDGFVWCDRCQQDVEGSCVRCGGLVQLKNTNIPLHTPDRARRTVPKGVLEVRPSAIHGLGVWALKMLPIGLKMGPYEGALRKATNSSYCWLLRDNKVIDAEDVTISNWLRYVNCARTCSEQNLVAFQYLGGMYYRTVQEIKAGQELLVYYGKEFAMELGIDVRKFHAPSEEDEANTFVCYYCKIGFVTKYCLEAHIRTCHSKTEYMFQCLTCIVSFTMKYLYEDHMLKCRGAKRKDAGVIGTRPSI